MLTRKQLVQEALNSEDFDGMFDGAITNDDIRGYIKDTHHITVTTGEISDIRAGLAWRPAACEMSREEAATLNCSAIDA